MVAATPFTVEVMTPVEPASVFDEITLVVATTPLIAVVNVLPLRDCVKELTIEASVLETPFTIVWKRLALLDATVVLMIDDADAIPFTVLVAVFPAVVNVFVVALGVSAVVATTPLIVAVRRLVLVA